MTKFTIHSSLAYLLFVAGLWFYACRTGATFEGFATWTFAGFTAYIGRRLWRQLKLPGGVELENNGNGEQTDEQK